jgi:O-antigen ligase
MVQQNSTADKYVAIVLMLSFFLPMHVQVLVLFPGCAYFIYRTIKDKQTTPAKNYLAALALGVLYILYMAAPFFTPQDHMQPANSLRETRVSYLLLPLVFAAIGRQKLQAIVNQLLYFVYFSVATCIVTNLWFVLKFALSPGGFNGVNHVTYRIFFEEITQIHPTYISMYLVFSIGILLTNAAGLNRNIKYALFYTLVVLLLPLLAKSPLLALGVIMLHAAWLKRKELMRYKWLFAVVVVVMAASYLFIPFVSQRVNEMAGITASVKQNVTDNSIHERKMILEADWDMIKRYWLWGCGPGRVRYILKIKYLFYSMYYGRDVGAFDPHNEYFYHWLSFGVAGIVLFLFSLIIHFRSAIRRNQYLYLYLLLTMCITFFTESVLATQRGVVLWAFFTSLLYFYNKRPELQE